MNVSCIHYHALSHSAGIHVKTKDETIIYSVAQRQTRRFCAYLNDWKPAFITEVILNMTNTTHSQSINLVTEDLVAGHRPNGKMSTVRRFFCLFVTFDLLFTSLLWLICVMMKGETVLQIVNREIIHYDIKISLFDIVIVAILRFTWFSPVETPESSPRPHRPLIFTQEQVCDL
ncbi:putative cholesterol transporter BmStart1 [Operophtera brumata]|uniref:Putative cholesterol transporter BmStart1 n=1 Tax=Operophtera brumata TaxID=104452 RepID=A0A0L7L4X1_OPEBR|nr:putative cholesterol transporter BmStart1 [Operophtera brumata]